MNAGAAVNVARQPLLPWAVGVGMLSYGLLMTFAIMKNTGAPTVAAGMRTGAVVSGLLWLTADFMLYGISNIGDLTGVVVDPLLKLVPGAIAGGLIAVVLQKTVGASRSSDQPGANVGRAA